MHTKLPKLALNQETICNLLDSQRTNALFISQAPFCNTKFVSCPECNPPRR